MNALRNRVLLIGRLGQDPERIDFDGDKVKASFRLATNEVYRNTQGDKTETTQWHNVIAWGQLAEIMSKYLSKGSEVAIEGRLVYRQYEDKQGQSRVAAEIVTQEMLMLDRVPQDS
jgi:single-strand DNA-binding protein